MNCVLGTAFIKDFRESFFELYQALTGLTVLKHYIINGLDIMIHLRKRCLMEGLHFLLEGSAHREVALDKKSYRSKRRRRGWKPTTDCRTTKRRTST